MSRDLPVLRALVEAFDDPERYRMSPEEIKTVTAFSDDDVHLALRVLNEASPPLIKGTMVNQPPIPSWSWASRKEPGWRRGNGPNPKIWWTCWRGLLRMPPSRATRRKGRVFDGLRRTSEELPGILQFE